jgi:hypothetical protein
MHRKPRHLCSAKNMYLTLIKVFSHALTRPFKILVNAYYPRCPLDPRKRVKSASLRGHAGIDPLTDTTHMTPVNEGKLLRTGNVT